MVITLTAVFCIFALISMSSYFDRSDDQLNKIAIFITLVLLTSLAAFRPAGVDRDYLQYVFLLYEERPFMEPTFYYLSFVLKALFTNPVLPLFLLYAMVGVIFKIFAIKKISDYWLLSTVIYVSYSFTLHDMTQIRVGAAIGFLLLAIPSLYERNFLQFVALITLATLFHYSAAIMVILWFIKPLKINRWFYFFLLTGSYVMVRYIEAAIFNIFAFFPEAFQARALNYDNDFGGELNIFNTWQLMRCAISFVFLIYCDKLSSNNKYALLLIKYYIVGTAMYVLLSSNAAFSTRFSDIFFAFDILSLPLLVHLFRYAPIGKFIVIVISSTYVFMNLYYNQIFS